MYRNTALVKFRLLYQGINMKKNGIIKAKKRYNFLARLCGFLNDSNWPRNLRICSRLRRQEFSMRQEAKRVCAYEKSGKKETVNGL